jgi:hypothetical protein
VRGHADPETLAAFREELLPRRRARQVAAHLAHCTRCAGLDARLADLPGLLASAPAPPMPDALAARIEAAIAGEAAARAATSTQGVAGTELAAAADGPAGAGTPARARVTAGPDVADGATRGHRRRPPTRDRSRLALRIAAAAAAVAVVAGGGYGASRLFSSAGPQATASGAAGTGSVPRAAPAEKHGTGRMNTALSGGPQQGASSANGAQPGVVVSGTNYLPGRLRAQVEAALTQVHRPAPTQTPFGPQATGRIAGCVAHVTGGTRPLLVIHARYEGKPATIIVVPTIRANVARAVVVGPACSATVTDRLASTTLPG